MATRIVLVKLNGDSSNAKKLDLTDREVATVEDLLKEAQNLFGLEKETISHLQIWDKKFEEYANLEEADVGQVQDGCKLNVVLKGDAGDAGEAPRDCLLEEMEMSCTGCSDLGLPPSDHQSDQQAAIAPNNRLWDKTTINTYFLNDIPQSWTYSGHKYTVPTHYLPHVIDRSDILRLANNWSTELPPAIKKEERECVPTFVEVSDPMNSDIRVWFNETGKRESKVGTDANHVQKGGQEQHATMFLDLCGTDRYKEHLVMHEFGHALGLGHEHQRVVFWETIGKFLNLEKVKKHFGAKFSTDVQSYAKGTPGPRSEYDPDSIMHYWFKPLYWLQDRYNTPDKVKRLPPGDITPEERTALLAFHRKGKHLAEVISQKDHHFIAQTYYAQKGATSTSPSNGPAETSQAASDNPAGSSAVSPPLADPDSSSSPPVNPEPDYEADKFVLTLNEHFAKLLEAAFDARNKWRFIGNGLNLNPNNLESIHNNKHGKPSECFNEMLAEWLQSSNSCTLGEFLRVLKLPTVRMNHLCERVREAMMGRKRPLPRDVPSPTGTKKMKNN